MELIIRPPELRDAAQLAAIRRKDGVRENTLGLVTNTNLQTEEFLKNGAPDRYMLVGELDGKIVGMIGLHVSQNPRMNHTASFGLSVDSDFQGRGFGRKLLEAIIDLSENWLMIARLELGVIVDNTRAIALYESMGFEKEGVKRWAIKRGGVYMDEIIMSRLNKNMAQPPNKLKENDHAEQI